MDPDCPSTRYEPAISITTERTRKSKNLFAMCAAGKYRENTAIVTDKPVGLIIRSQANCIIGANSKRLRNTAIIQDPFIIIGSEETDRIALSIEVVDSPI